MQIADIDFCGPGDLASLIAIESACFKTPWATPMIEYDLNNPGPAIYMKAVMKGVTVGYGVLSMSETASHLMNLAVLPEFRMRCVALQLMSAFDELSRLRGCDRMRLEVRSSNVVARKFYASLGFVYSCREKAYYADGEDGIVLVSRLPLKIEYRMRPDDFDKHIQTPSRG
ncbi:MAG: ribosomal protein S18-alanine N-acetyltransferase [Synergistaceae bacterium]|jgi:ribosomal-protein-alanine N-acetyltransferase|nr:ribosomal protein S18-alanine N-acetyltransferase [Synergistaceae bacterium]